MKKTVKPVIEVDRIEVISRLTQRYGSWCAGCREAVEMVRVDEAAAIAGTSVEQIIEHAADGKIHLGIRPEALLFCVNSIVRHAPPAKSGEAFWH